MNLAEFKGDIARRPLLPLTETQCEELRESLKEEGVLT